MAGGGTEHTCVTMAQIDHLAKGGERAGRKLEKKNLYYHCTGRYNLTAHPHVVTKRVCLKPLGEGRSQSNTGERDQSDTHVFNRFTTPQNWTP